MVSGCLFSFSLVKVLSSGVAKYWLRHKKDLSDAFSKSVFTTFLALLTVSVHCQPAYALVCEEDLSRQEQKKKCLTQL